MGFFTIANWTVRLLCMISCKHVTYSQCLYVPYSLIYRKFFVFFPNLVVRMYCNGLVTDLWRTHKNNYLYSAARLLHGLNSGLFRSSGGNIPACWRELSGIFSRPFVTACAPDRFTAQIRTFKLGTMPFPDCVESLVNKYWDNSVWMLFVWSVSPGFRLKLLFIY
jgi:hypothetical protein